MDTFLVSVLPVRQSRRAPPADENPSFFFFGRPLHPPLASHPRPPLLLQHDVGRDEERSRALELLQGGAQDLQALPRRADHLGRPHRGHHRALDVARPAAVARRRGRAGAVIFPIAVSTGVPYFIPL